MIMSFILFSTTGCIGLIVHGSTQDIAFSSTPPNAEVYIDGVSAVRTPGVLSLNRGDSHLVEIKLDGYEDYSFRIDKKTSVGVVIGDILLTGLVGLVIDVATGALYYLTPEQVVGTLSPKVTQTEDRIFISVVLDSREDWVQIGQMNPL